MQTATFELYGHRIARGSGKALPDQLYEVLQREILRGRWKAGERIPSYRALIELTGLSQTPIQAALQRLADDGYVRRVRHKGVFVKSTHTPGNSSLGELLIATAQDEPQHPGHSGMPVATQMFGLVNVLSLQEEARKLGLCASIVPLPTDTAGEDADGAAERFAADGPAARQRSRSSRDGGIEPEVKARERRRMLLGGGCKPREGRPFVEVSQRRDRAQDPVAAGQHFFDGQLGIVSLLPAGQLKPWLGGKAPGVVYLGTDDPFSTPALTGDLCTAAYLVTRRLLQLGHCRIAALPCAYMTNAVREQASAGMVHALEEAGLPAQDVLANGAAPQTPPDLKGIRRFLEQHSSATAVLCFSIDDARRLVELAELMGIAVPADLSVASLQTEGPRRERARSILGAAYDWKEIIRRCFEVLLSPDEFAERSVSRIVFSPQVQGEATAAPPRDG